MAAFSAQLILSDTRLVVVPAAVVASGDTFDIALGRAGIITGITFDNCNNVAGVFSVSKVSATGVVTSICNVTAAGATGNEITASVLYTALFATTPTPIGARTAGTFWPSAGVMKISASPLAVPRRPRLLLPPASGL